MQGTACGLLITSRGGGAVSSQHHRHKAGLILQEGCSPWGDLEPGHLPPVPLSAPRPPQESRDWPSRPLGIPTRSQETIHTSPKVGQGPGKPCKTLTPMRRVTRKLTHPPQTASCSHSDTPAAPQRATAASVGANWSCCPEPRPLFQEANGSGLSMPGNSLTCARGTRMHIRRQRRQLCPARAARLSAKRLHRPTAGPPQGPQSQPRLFQAQDGPTQERLTLQGSVSQLWHRRAGRMAVEKGTLLNSRKSLTALSAFWHT